MLLAKRISLFVTKTCCAHSTYIDKTGFLIIMVIMAIRVAEFSSEGCKIRKIFPKTYPREIIEFGISSELSKIGHHFSNKVIQKLI